MFCKSFTNPKLKSWSLQSQTISCWVDFKCLKGLSKDSLQKTRLCANFFQKQHSPADGRTSLIDRPIDRPSIYRQVIEQKCVTRSMVKRMIDRPCIDRQVSEQKCVTWSMDSVDGSRRVIDRGGHVPWKFSNIFFPPLTQSIHPVDSHWNRSTDPSQTALNALAVYIRWKGFSHTFQVYLMPIHQKSIKKSFEH